MVRFAGLDSNNEFEAETVKDHIKNLAASAVDVSGLANQVSGSVAHQSVSDRLDIDLGISVNEISEVTGPTDVYFKDVTTADGRTNPDGMGTLLVVAKGAEMLTWPGGTVVHGTPPEGQTAMASLVRVGGSVIVVWPPTVAASPAAGITAQVATLEQIIGAEVEVQPGGTVLQDAEPDAGMTPAVFVNPFSRPTKSDLVLSTGHIEQILSGGNRFTARAEHRSNGISVYSIQATATYDPTVEPLKDNDGWLVAVAPADGSVSVYQALGDIRMRVGVGTNTYLSDGSLGVVLLYKADDPNWTVLENSSGASLYYNGRGSGDVYEWQHGLVRTANMRLPMHSGDMHYASLGIALPGTFHRAAELEGMGVYLGA